ncbi:OpgC family protein [Pararhizobium sp.]|uniref:OpgC family protein n=1 Tax=Pararhizobium sp. TaxID=1977563 RepID=UPI0027164A35|nr:OpgC domain-containing protein [Pararhizobium sp.]MDO9417761.1 OpgC domain-containing protein [Pararhizobium sp.]
MKRFDIIDGMRGYFLVFMLINHLVFVGDYWLMEVNHRQFAFVEDAQGFVFLSGLIIGMVYARKMLKTGYETGRQLIWARAFELYRYAMGIVMVALVARMILPDAARVWYNWLGTTSFDDPLRLAAVATFVFQPTFMDILPQYIVYMIFAPVLIWACLQGKWPYVLAGSLMVWTAGQLGLQQIITTPLNDWIKGADDQGIRVSFNLLGWQIVFFSALVIGALTAQGKIEWRRIFAPEKTLLPKMALTICLFFLPLRILTAHEFMPEFMLGKFSTMEIRADFGPVYLLNFAAVAVGLAWVLIAGPEHRSALVRRIAAGVTWVFSIRFLQLLGRHSLQVYVGHVAIVYVVYYIDGRTPALSELTKTAIALVCIALLPLPALWREREKLFGWGAKTPVEIKGES